MSITLQLATPPAALSGVNLRAELGTDMTAIQNEVNNLDIVTAGLTMNVTTDWVSGTVYAIGDFRRSPINFQTYRRLTAGAGATDPSADPVNWIAAAAGNASQVFSAAPATNPEHVVRADQVQDQSVTAFITGGISTAYTLTPIPALAALAANQRFRVKFHATPGAAPTLAVSGLAATALKCYDYTGTKVAISPATVVANLLSDVEYDGVDYVVMDALNTPIADARLDPNLLYKLNSLSTAFVKTAAATISVKAGTSAMVFGVKLAWAANTAVTMPVLVAGTDYAIYACTDGSIRADSSFLAPAGYTAANSRQIGGFHYGLVAPGTTVAGGLFATAGNGKIWVQADVDAIAGINTYSIWDSKFRPKCDPRGMVLVDGQTWVDIYLCSTDTAANGTSKYNTNIGSGTVLPKIPAAFGGNGVTTYPTLNWWVANELARANQKRLMSESEFVTAAYGVTENQSIDATASTYPTTLRNAGYTSKYGIEQASGHQWIWGEDSNFYSEAASPAGSWKDVNGNTGAAGAGRGQDYTFGVYGLSRVILGGARAVGALSGSRASIWNSYPWSSSWSISLRAACDHMMSV